jgi:hypothetical protein
VSLRSDGGVLGPRSLAWSLGYEECQVVAPILRGAGYRSTDNIGWMAFQELASRLGTVRMADLTTSAPESILLAILRRLSNYLIYGGGR